MSYLEQVKKGMEMVRGIAENPVPHTDIEGIKKKMNDLTNIASNADHLLGLARTAVLEKRATEMDRLLLDGMSKTAISEFAKANCSKEEGIYLYCTSVVKTIKSNLDTYRSILSAYKEEMQSNTR